MSVSKIIRNAGKISGTRHLDTMGINPVLVKSFEELEWQVSLVYAKPTDIAMASNCDVNGINHLAIDSDLVCQLSKDILEILNQQTSHLIEDVVFYHNNIYDCVVNNIPHSNIVCSSQALKEQSETINQIYKHSRVIVPYISENLYKDYSTDRKKKCVSIKNTPVCFEYKSELIDLVKINMPLVDIFNQYEIYITNDIEANTEWPLAAMLCGCIPILIKNDNNHYNESIFRNGETCFVVESKEELLDSINLVIMNEKLTKNMRRNISEIVALFNNKEHFLDSWTSVIKEIK
jgi:hypothetical protein